MAFLPDRSSPLRFPLSAPAQNPRREHMCSYLLKQNLKILQQTLKPSATRYTGRLDRMSRRKWRESKQQPSIARSGHEIGCCLVSLHFLCDILSPCPVSCCVTHLISEWISKPHWGPLQGDLTGCRTWNGGKLFNSWFDGIVKDIPIMA